MTSNPRSQTLSALLNLPHAATRSDAYGAVLAGGYSLMLHRNLNLEFGAAFWTGRTDYTTYACPRCGRITGSGTKWFILPSSVMASLVWVF